MREMVYINGIYSRIYDLRQGTRQGGILSSWLFLVYIKKIQNMSPDIRPIYLRISAFMHFLGEKSNF